MATSSISKSIRIKTNAQARKFAHALECSRVFKREPVIYSRTVSEMSREEMLKIFGDNNDRVQDSES